MVAVGFENYTYEISRGKTYMYNAHIDKKPKTHNIVISVPV